LHRAFEFYFQAICLKLTYAALAALPNTQDKFDSNSVIFARQSPKEVRLFANKLQILSSFASVLGMVQSEMLV